MQMAAGIDTATGLAEASRYLELTASRKLGPRAAPSRSRPPTNRRSPDCIARSTRFYAAFATHGRSGISRLLLGSVAAAILSRATVPVLLVGPGVLTTNQPNS